MHLHSNAALLPRQRQLIQSSTLPYAALAQQFHVSKATIHHWKHQESCLDRSCRPKTVHTALDEQEGELVLWLRRTAHLPLDELLDAVHEVLPHARRSSLHRALVRHGCSRLPKQEQQPTGQPGTFKEYGPGYLHIDCFYLPKLDGQKHPCFVAPAQRAPDRATRLVFLWVYEHKDKQAATDFLKRCLEFFPFKVEKILTDNGREFTLHGFKNRYGGAKTEHPFDAVCREAKIEHRLTRPYTPKTNGMVERTNGLIKEGTTRKNRYQNSQEMKDDLQCWFVLHNFHRKLRRIGRITPYEAVCKWHQKQPEIFLREPPSLLAYCSQPTGT
jgi:transposase InsO family protein